MSRPDVSFYLAHFTSTKFPKGYKDVDNPTNIYKHQTAISRLESILRNRTVYASTLPWTNKRAVCLTECPWTSLIEHTKQYSPYGLGFSKQFIFATGGSASILCES